MSMWKAKRTGRVGDSVTLRGGRLRKSARGVLSYAPWLGRLVAAAAPAAAAVVMGAGLFAGGSLVTSVGFSSEAWAQVVCGKPTLGSNSVWNCSGTHSTTAIFEITLDEGMRLVNTIASANHALKLTATASHAIRVTTSGVGNATLNMDEHDSQFIRGTGHGLWVDHNAIGNIVIDTAGEIRGGRTALDNNNALTVIGGARSYNNITINNRATLRATGDGLGVAPNGGETVTITNSGRISAGAGVGDSGIEVTTPTNAIGDVTITHTGGIDEGVSGNIGIDVHHRGTSTTEGTITIGIGGRVFSDHSSTAIRMRGGMDGVRGRNLVLLPGFAFNDFVGNMDEVTADKESTLVLDGGAGTSANLNLTTVMPLFHDGESGKGNQFTRFEKIGKGTWVFSGQMPSNRTFTRNAFVFDGVVRLTGGTQATPTLIRMGSNTNFDASSGGSGQQGVVEISGHAEVTGFGMEVSGGRLSLATSGDNGTDERLKTTEFTVGGTVTMNVNFDTGAADVVEVSGGMSTGPGGSSTLNLIAEAGDINSFTGSIKLFDITGTGSSDDNNLVPGTLTLADGSQRSFALFRVTSGADQHDWFVRMATPKCSKDEASGVITLTCSGSATSGDPAIMETATSGNMLVVNTLSGFELRVNAGTAVSLTGATGSTGIDANFVGPITANGGHGVVIDNDGTGAVDLAVDSVAVGGSGNAGIDIDNAASGGAVTVTVNGDLTSRGGHGIDIDQKAAAAVRVTTAAGTGVNARGTNADGIRVVSAGDVTIRAGSNIGVSRSTFRVAGRGVFVDARTGVTDVQVNNVFATGRGIAIESGGGNVVLVTDGEVFSEENDGILINHLGSGTLSITARGDVTGATGDHTLDGIEITAGANVTSVNVTTMGDVTGSEAIDINSSNPNVRVTLDIGGVVTATRTQLQNAIDINGGSTHNITIRDSIVGEINSTTAAATTLTLDNPNEGASLSGIPALDLSDVRNIETFVKAGSGIWQLNGTQGTATGEPFDSVDFRAGTLRMNAAQLRTGGTVSVPVNGTLEVVGRSQIHAHLDVSANGAHVTLAVPGDDGTDEQLRVDNWVGGGKLTLNVDFGANGTSDYVSIAGTVSGTGSNRTLIDLVGKGNVSASGINQSFFVRAQADVTSNFRPGKVIVPITGGVATYDFSLQNFQNQLVATNVRNRQDIVKCVVDANTAGTWNCSGGANALFDRTQTLSSGMGEDLVVNTASGFGMHVVSGHGFVLSNSSGDAITATIGGPITTSGTGMAAGDGVRVRHSGSRSYSPATLNITSNGALTVSGDGINAAGNESFFTVNANGNINAGGDGVYFKPNGAGYAFVRGSITAGSHGVHIKTDAGGGTVELTVENDSSDNSKNGAIVAAGGHGLFVERGAQFEHIDIDSGGDIGTAGAPVGMDGIRAVHEGNGSNYQFLIDITSSGDIFAAGKGIHAEASDIGNSGRKEIINITVNGDISAGDEGIFVDHNALGADDAVNITVAGDVRGSTGVQVDSASTLNTITLNINDGAAISASGQRAINLSGGASQIINFNGASSVSGYIQASATTNSINIADGAVATLTTNGAFSGTLTLNTGGTLSFDNSVAGGTANASDRLSVTTLAGGGTLRLNVDFANMQSDVLAVTGTAAGAVTGSTSIDIVGIGAIDYDAFTSVRVVDLDGMAVGDANSFTISEASAGLGAELSRDANGDWMLSYTSPAGCLPGSGGSFECSGVIGIAAAIDASSATGAIMVTDAAGTSFNVANATALDIDTGSSVTTLSVELDGDITSTGSNNDRHGIDVDHAGSGDVAITANGEISAAGTGIDINATNAAANIAITLSDEVSGGGTSAGAAINISGGDTHQLTLNPGGAIASGDSVTATTATLELAGDSGDTGATSFDLASLTNFTGFTSLDKSGAGTWTLSGAQPSGKAFDSADVDGGTLLLSAATVEMSNGNNLAVASGAVLGVSGESAINTGGVDLSAGGTLALAMSGDDGTDEELEVVDFVAGGMLQLNVNFGSAAGSDDASDQLVVSNSISRSSGSKTMIVLTVAGDAAHIDSGGVVLVNFTSGTAADSAIEAFELMGAAPTGTQLFRDSSGDWILRTMPTARCDSSGGVFTCMGAITSAQAFAGVANAAMSVTDEAGTSFEVADDTAITVTTHADTTSVTVELDGTITTTGSTGDRHGIDANNTGSGAMTITANGSITTVGTGGGNSDGYGIKADHSGEGLLTINTAAVTSTDARAIRFYGRGTGAGAGVDINASGKIESTGGGQIAIQGDLFTNGTMTIDVTEVESDHTAIAVGTANTPVSANPAGTAANAPITITATGDITAGGRGIGVWHRSNGDVRVNVASMTTGQEAVWARKYGTGSTGNIIVTVADGAVINSSHGSRAIDLGGGRGQSVNFDGTATISRGIRMDHAMGMFNITSGDMVTIGGTSNITGTLNLPSGGTLSLANNNVTDRVTTTNLFGNGTLVMNMSLTGTDAGDQVTVTGPATGTTTINLVLTGGTIADLDTAMPWAMVNASTADRGTDFVLGTIDGSSEHGLTVRRNSDGDWVLSMVSAGSCDAVTFVCMNSITQAQALVGGNGAMNVTDEDGTSFDVTTGNALTLTSVSGTTSMSVDIDGAISADDGAGVHATHSGSGELSISVGAVDATGGGAIFFDTVGNEVDIDASGLVKASGGSHIAIQGDLRRNGDINIDVVDVESVNGMGIAVGTGNNAVDSNTTGSAATGNITITATGTVTAPTRRGIGVWHRSDGDVTINANDIDAGQWGVRVYKQFGSNNTEGDIVVSASGEIDSGRGVAIDLFGGDSHRVILNTGGGLAAGDDVVSDRTDNVLELAAADGEGETGNMFDLAELSNWDGFAALEKSGAGTWTLSGTQPTSEAFTSLTVSGGTLALASGASLELENTSGGVDVTIGSGATITSGGITIATTASSGTSTVDVAGTVITTAATAVSMGHGATHILRLRPGASITGQVQSAGASGTTTIELADAVSGNAAGSFNFGTIPALLNFTHFDKTASSDWTITGVVGFHQFDHARVSTGTLRLNAMTFPMRTGSGRTPFTIASGATLEVQGASSITGTGTGLDNSAGTLSLAFGTDTGTDDSLQVVNYTAGGALVLNVNFAGTDDADTLMVTGVISGSGTSITLNVSGSASDIDSGGVLLVDASSSTNSPTDAFTLASGAPSGVMLARNGDGDWMLMAEMTGPVTQTPNNNCVVLSSDAPGGWGCAGSITQAQTLSGAMTVNVAAGTTTTSDGTITLATSVNNPTINLEGDTEAQGATNLAGALDGGTNANLNLRGGANTSGSLSLDGLANIFQFSKSGAGSWTLTGTHTAEESVRVDFNGGTLRFDGATLWSGTSVGVGANETLEVVGSSALRGTGATLALTAGGSVDLTADGADTNDVLRVDALSTAGGSVSLNVALVAGASDTADRINLAPIGRITSTSAATLNVAVTGSVDDLDSGGVLLIDGPTNAANSAANAFTGAVTLGGTATTALQVERNSAGNWMLVLAPTTPTGPCTGSGGTFTCSGAITSSETITGTGDVTVTFAAGSSTRSAATITVEGGTSRMVNLVGGTTTTDIQGDLDASGSGTLNLQGGAGTSGTLNFVGLSGFSRINKTGAGAWTLQGNQTIGRLPFAFTAGTLRLEGASINQGSANTEDWVLRGGNNGTLQVVGANTLSGDFSVDISNGAVGIDMATDGDVSATNERLTLANLAPSGGAARLNVAFGTGDNDDTADMITVGSSFTGTLRLDVVAGGDVAHIDANGITLIAAPQGNTATVRLGTLTGFVAGDVMLEQASNGNWVLMAAEVITPPPTQIGCTGTGGSFTCAGAIAEATTLAAASGEMLRVSSATTGFSIVAATGVALTLTGASGATGINATLNGPITANGATADDHAIAIDHDGGGAVALTTNAAVQAARGRGITVDTTSASTSLTINANANVGVTGGDNIFAHGIHAMHRGSGDMTIAVAGRAAVSGTQSGISATHAGTTGALNLTIDAGGSVTGASDALFVSNAGGDIDIAANGAVTSTGSAGMFVSAAGAGDIDIAANANVTANTTGIQLSKVGTGDVAVSVAAGATVSGASNGITAENNSSADTLVVDIAGTVRGTAPSDPIALRMSGAAEQRLILRATASITGSVSGVAATLELAADAGQSGSFHLADDLGDYTGFTALEKTGGGTFTLAGAQAADKAFTSATISAGTLALNAAQLRAATTIESGATLQADGSTTITGNVTNNATLQVDGATTITGALVNNGNITLNDSDTVDRLAITDFTTGGALTLNVAFDNSGVGSADMLTISGSVTRGSGATTINLFADNFPGALADPVTLIGTGGDAGIGADGDFEAGTLTAAGESRNFTLARDAATGAWQITGISGVITRGCHGQATAGTFLCVGALTEAVTLSAATGETLRVTDRAGFSVETATGAAMSLDAAAGSLGIDAIFTGALATTDAAADGLNINHQGGGSVSVTTAAVSGGDDGIDATTAATAAGMTITAEGDVSGAAGSGISVTHAGTGALSITANAEVSGGEDGIYADTAGTSATITANGDITAGSGQGVDIRHAGSGELRITLAGGATITAGDTTNGHGISTDTEASSTATSINAGGASIGTSANPVGQDGISANHRGAGALSITAGTIHAGDIGIDADASGSATGMSINATGAINAADDGIYAEHAGTGALAITTRAITGGDYGIYATTSSTATGMTINTNGAVSGVDTGILVNHLGGGNVAVSAGAVTSMTADAINALAESGSTGLSVEVSGAVSSTAMGDGIDANHRGTGRLEVTVAAGGRVSGQTGISADTNNAAAAIVVDIAGSVDGTAATDPTAISMSGGANQRLVLRSGWSIGSGDAVAADSGAVLELAGTSGSFDLGDLDEWSGFTSLEQSGSGTWTITGMQPADKAFTSVDVAAGTMHLNNAGIRAGDTTLTVAVAATLRAGGSSMITGSVANNGMMDIDGNLDISADLANAGMMMIDGSLDIAGSFSGAGDIHLHDDSVALTANDTGDSVSVTGDFAGGGTVTLNANLETGGADRLSVTGNVTGSPTTVNVRVVAGEVTAAPTALNTPLVDVAGSSSAEDFRAGDLHAGMYVYDFALSQANGEWNMESIDLESQRLIAGGRRLSNSVPIYESYIGTLAELSRLESMRERMSNRVWTGLPGAGFWASWNASRATIRPAATTSGGEDGGDAGSEYEVRDTAFRLGAEAPLNESWSLGGNFALNQADSKISSPVGDGDIELEGFAAAVTTTWSGQGFYADGQLQYAAFTADLKGGEEALTQDNDSTSWSASIEVGYELPLGAAGFSLTPQAQLAWGNVEFEDFIDPTEASITTDDGDILTSRFGIALERAWDGGGSDGLFYGSADVRLPLDGESAAGIDEDVVVSELEEIVLDLGAGLSWQWDEQYAVFGEVGTSHGDEVEEYGASLGLRVGF